jgi:glycosyltransferase involved in cell wall biosynthesis
VPRGTAVVAHPSADLYGSDLQLVESVAGLVAAGWRVVVCLPAPGPLVDRLRDAGASVEIVPVPVLRKSLANPLGLLRLAGSSLAALPRQVRLLRRERAHVVYVNTVTIPLWLVAARLARRPALAHVHEAEDDSPRLVALLLNTPLRLARTVVVNSRAAAGTLLRVVPSLRSRTTVVYNGVPGPDGTPEELVRPGDGGPRRVVLVGRLSPRKGPDVAVEAVALLRQQGLDVDLEVCGSVFPGYEWFEEQLRTRIDQLGLGGHVRLSGYTSPTWPALARAEVALVPSRAEPFGNTAVEAQLAGRPVVASDVQGLREIVTSGETGLLVPPGDPARLAEAVGALLRDPDLAAALTVAGRASALHRFTVDRYRTAIVERVEQTRRR